MAGNLLKWMNAYAGGDRVWYMKRLSGNDTLANHSHQAAPYIPRDFVFGIFPELSRPDLENPDIRFDLSVDSHADRRTVRAIWYNNRFHDTAAKRGRGRGRGRGETRVTGFGRAASSLLNPENTGALTVFAFSVAGHPAYLSKRAVPGERSGE